MNSLPGGAYDTVPEVCILLALFEHSEKDYVPIIFDEAGTSIYEPLQGSFVNSRCFKAIELLLSIFSLR